MNTVLLVNACLIGDNNGTGNTLASIFKSVPDDLTYELCIDFLRKPTDDEHIFYVDKSFSLIRWSLAKRRASIQQSETAAKHRANISGARATGYKAIIHEIFRGFADVLPTHISSSMDQFISRVKPKYIYTCGSSVTSLSISRKIAKKYNLPLVLHIMDNWEETLYSSSIFAKPFSLALKRELKKANKYSEKSLAISKALCEKYSDRYKTTYYPLMNTVDKIESEPMCFNRDKLVFLYAGSLSINRYVSLCQVAKAINSVIGKNKYIFKLFVPAAQNTDEIRNMFSQYSVEINDYIPRQQLLEEYHNSDILVISESFDKNFCDFTKYSLSTKLPEYMSAGKPILAYLSEELYSYTYLLNSHAAAVASCEEELLSELEKLSAYDYRLRLAENGLRFVNENNSREYCNKVLSEIFV